MNNWKGILRIKTTDEVSKIGIERAGDDSTTITLPSTQVGNLALYVHLRIKLYPTPSLLGMAHAESGMQYDKMFIEDGNYTEDFYSDFLPYIMGRVQGKVMLPNKMLWHLMERNRG